MPDPHSKKKKHFRFLALGLLLTLQVRAITFDFVFDSDPVNPGLQPPIVATGSFTFANDLGDGSHPFLSLGAYSMSFSFPTVVGADFDKTHVVSDLSEVLVVLSTDAVGRRLQFSSSKVPDFGAVIFYSLELKNGPYSLNFSHPSVDSALEDYFVDITGVQVEYGQYEARIAPAPHVPDNGSTLMLGGIGLAALVWASRQAGR